MALSPGSVVADRYRLTRLVGEGGMGEVWEATHVMTGRKVAVKRLRAELDRPLHGRARARFVLEARAACAVEHPNVVEILDFAESDGEPPIIAMELLRGETLAQKLERDGALSVEETARLLLPVVSAVGTAHSRGIVHRDLKPANVFLEASSGATLVKVLDFGIAKWVSARTGEGSLRTETGSTLGTPCYMAPEQALGERIIDHRADIWSLGVMLYECLSGSRPVEGENAARIMVRLMKSGIMPIERLVRGLPEELSSLVGKMLAREPSLRPVDLREVAAVLERLTKEHAPAFGEPQGELASSDIVPELGLDASAPPVSAALRRTSQDRRRKTRSWVFLGVGALLGTVGIAGFGWRPAPEGSAPTRKAEIPTPAAPRFEPDAPTEPATPAPSAPVATVVEASAKPAAVRQRAAPATAGSVVPSPPAPSAGAPPGAACERSRDCASRLCLAFTCR